MSLKFSQKVRATLIDYIKTNHGLVISDEQADEFLDSMADFYLWFNSSENQRPPAEGGGADSDSYPWLDIHLIRNYV